MTTLENPSQMEQQPRTTDSVIQTEELVKIFGTRRVVNGINLTVSAGEVVGLLGPNGAGKTTSFI